MPEIAHESIASAPSAASVGQKSEGAFKTISEVADMLGLQQHVLRFWESRFKQIRPLKMRGGRRYYRPEDIEIIVTIRSLLYDEGYTIEGAKRALEHARKTRHAFQEPMATQAALTSAIQLSAEVLHPRVEAKTAVAPVRKMPAASPPNAAERKSKLEIMRDELLSIRDELTSLRSIAVA